jgi:hypothetical protein
VGFQRQLQWDNHLLFSPFFYGSSPPTIKLNEKFRESSRHLAVILIIIVNSVLLLKLIIFGCRDVREERRLSVK